MGEVVLEANSKHGALRDFLKSSQGTLMGHPGQGPPHWVDRSGVGWGLLRASLPLPAYPKWAFLGLPGAQCPLWVVASTRPHRVPSILRVSLQVLPEKALVAAGSFLRAPGLCSGQVPELGAELGPSNLRSHPQTGQDTWCMASQLPSGSARALGVLWLDALSSLWLTRPCAAWFLHRHNLPRTVLSHTKWIAVVLCKHVRGLCDQMQPPHLFAPYLEHPASQCIPFRAQHPA